MPGVERGRGDYQPGVDARADCRIGPRARGTATMRPRTADSATARNRPRGSPASPQKTPGSVGAGSDVTRQRTRGRQPLERASPLGLVFLHEPQGVGELAADSHLRSIASGDGAELCDLQRGRRPIRRDAGQQLNASRVDERADPDLRAARGTGATRERTRTLPTLEPRVRQLQEAGSSTSFERQAPPRAARVRMTD